MELGLSLGDRDASKPLRFMEKSYPHEVISSNTGLGFCMGLSIGPSVVRDDADDHHQRRQEEEEEEDYHQNGDKQTSNTNTDKDEAKKAADPPKDIQLINLLPDTPVVPRNPKPSFLAFPWTSDKGSSAAACACSSGMARGFDVNKFPLVEESQEFDGAAALSSSPKSNNSAASSFQMDFCIHSNSASGGNNKRDFEIDGETERASSRACSDEDENGSTRKKLRLSKEQSAFLEESFKEHNTLNPKQKLALAKQLNLRPRQVEVWFQNRRARTKLKQTEVDCEYLKRCCETLTEENRRLQKELQELRALKTCNPFYMKVPATTLTMCPSCERVATTTNPPATTTNTTSDPSTGFSLTTTTTTTTTRPRFFPFSPHNQSHAQQLEKK